MAIGTPTSLGTPVANATFATTATFTTTVTAPSSSLIIAVCTWGAGADLTGTMSGGGLTWSTDQSNSWSFSYFFRVGIFSAPAASGLASSTVLTLTTSGSTDGKNISVVYVTGMDLTGTRKDTSTGQGALTNAWSSGSSSTTNAADLLIGGSLIDSATSSTATAGETELFDWQNATNIWTSTVAYKIVAASGSQLISGTWLASANEVSAFAAYKGSGGATATVKQLAALGVG